jgi:hypothetical protein
LAICYPYHRLFGQTVAIVQEGKLFSGEQHYRIVSGAGERTIVPAWMFDPSAFDALPVEHPLLDFDALLDLHALVASTLSSLGIRTCGDDKEEIVDGPIATVSRPRSDQRAATRRNTT